MREITKDASEYVDVYISPSAIKEIAGGFKGITGDIKQYGEAIGSLVRKKEIQHPDGTPIPGQYQIEYAPDIREKMVQVYGEQGVQQLETSRARYEEKLRAQNLPEEQITIKVAEYEYLNIFRTNLQSAINQYGSEAAVPLEYLSLLVKNHNTAMAGLAAIAGTVAGAASEASANQNINGLEYTVIMGAITAKTTGENIKDGVVNTADLLLKATSYEMHKLMGDNAPQFVIDQAYEYHHIRNNIKALATDIAENPGVYGQAVAQSVADTIVKSNELREQGRLMESAIVSGELLGEITSIIGGAKLAEKLGIAVTKGVGQGLKTIGGAKVAQAAGSGLDFGRKLDFLFAHNIDPSKPYNVQRSIGNANRIGIADTPANRTEVMRLFNQAYNNPSSIVGPGSSPGSVVREFYLPGVTGTGSKVQFVEKNGKIITIMAK